jgi:hypothetical protein
MMTLDKQDRATVVIALGVAIEHTRKAIRSLLSSTIRWSEIQ